MEPRVSDRSLATSMTSEQVAGDFEVVATASADSFWNACRYTDAAAAARWEVADRWRRRGPEGGAGVSATVDFQEYQAHMPRAVPE